MSRISEAIEKAKQYVAAAQRMFNERDYSLAFYEDQLELAEALLAVVGDSSKYPEALMGAQAVLERAHMTHYDQKTLVAVIRELVKLALGERWLLAHFRTIIDLAEDERWGLASLSHSEVAGKVRMLRRQDDDFEPVITAARDRIIWLAERLERREDDLKVVQARLIGMGGELHSYKSMFEQLMGAVGALSTPDGKLRCIAEGPERDELEGLYRRWAMPQPRSCPHCAGVMAHNPGCPEAPALAEWSPGGVALP